MGSKNYQKSYTPSRRPFFGVTPMPKYGQKSTFDREVIALSERYRLELRPLISTLRACIAPHVVLENTLGPPHLVPLKDH